MGSHNDLAPCGTPSAYERHRKRGEPIDEACRKARRAHRQKYAPNRVMRTLHLVQVVLEDHPDWDTERAMEEIRSLIEKKGWI